MSKQHEGIQGKEGLRSSGHLPVGRPLDARFLYEKAVLSSDPLTQGALESPSVEKEQRGQGSIAQRFMEMMKGRDPEGYKNMEKWPVDEELAGMMAQGLEHVIAPARGEEVRIGGAKTSYERLPQRFVEMMRERDLQRYGNVEQCVDDEGVRPVVQGLGALTEKDLLGREHEQERQTPAEIVPRFSLQEILIASKHGISLEEFRVQASVIEVHVGPVGRFQSDINRLMLQGQDYEDARLEVEQNLSPADWEEYYNEMDIMHTSQEGSERVTVPGGHVQPTMIDYDSHMLAPFSEDDNVTHPASVTDRTAGSTDLGVSFHGYSRDDLYRGLIVTWNEDVVKHIKQYGGISNQEKLYLRACMKNKYKGKSMYNRSNNYDKAYKSLYMKIDALYVKEPMCERIIAREEVANNVGSSDMVGSSTHADISTHGYSKDVLRRELVDTWNKKLAKSIRECGGISDEELEYLSECVTVRYPGKSTSNRSKYFSREYRAELKRINYLYTREKPQEDEEEIDEVEEVIEHENMNEDENVVGDHEEVGNDVMAASSGEVVMRSDNRRRGNRVEKRPMDYTSWYVRIQWLCMNEGQQNSGHGYTLDQLHTGLVKQWDQRVVDHIWQAGGISRRERDYLVQSFS